MERLVPKREGRVLEDPRRPGGLPHKLCSIPKIGIDKWQMPRELPFQEEDAHHAPVLQTSQIRGFLAQSA
jgi:hypothetical protein